MIVGREPERLALERLLGNARAGVSGALVLHGEPGVGKTALIEYAVDNAAAAGMRVLRAVGTEFESGMAFATLHELLRDVVGLVAALPPRQREALRTALGLAEAGPADRFAVSAGLLDLLAAHERPLLVAVDDCQWIDAASADALAFAARRVGAERVVLLFATRDDDPQAFFPAGVPTLPLAGLDGKAARELLAGDGIILDVADALVEATHGNPLALLELPALLPLEQRTGLAPLADPVPLPARLERVFAGRIQALPGSTRRALVVAAAGASGDGAATLRALAAGGHDADALEAADAAGLIRLGVEAMEFRHPLVRAAVYASAPIGERRAAHRLLAAALEGRDRNGHRVWHLAAGAAGPDEATAAALEAAAETARYRGGAAAAAHAYAESARLSPERDQQARRTFASACEWLRAGELDRGAAPLTQALELAREPRLRAEIYERQAYLAVQRGDAETAYRQVLETAAKLAASEPRAAAILLSTATSYPLAQLDAGTLLELGERIERLWGGPKPDPARPKLHIRANRARILAGETEHGLRGMLDCGRLCERLPATGAAAECAESLVWADQSSPARALLEREIASAREAGDHLLLAFALNPLVQLELRAGRLFEAYAVGLEAVEVAEAIGQPLQLAYNLAVLARAEAALGHEHACREHAAHALRLVDPDRYRDVQADARAALGQLALATGRADEAIVELERVRDILVDGAIVEPGYLLPWASDLVEAYARARRFADAGRELAALEERVARTGRTAARAGAARARGLLAADDDCEPLFEFALGLQREVGSRLEELRTEVAYAERLRRSRRKAAARERLRAALERFPEFSETPWAAHARNELAAAGARTRQPHHENRPRLTRQERQVAIAVTEGATNREIATRLFLSPKTVEFHLGNIYRKLDIRSRTQLAALARHTLAASGLQDEHTPTPAGTQTAATASQ